MNKLKLCSVGTRKPTLSQVSLTSWLNKASFHDLKFEVSASSQTAILQCSYMFKYKHHIPNKIGCPGAYERDMPHQTHQSKRDKYSCLQKDLSHSRKISTMI